MFRFNTVIKNSTKLHGMKKIIAASLMMLFAGVLAHAQPVTENVKITVDQVPLSVRNAYEREIGTLPEDGSWTVRVILERGASHLTPKPMAYTYKNRKNKEKVEVRFTTEGEITYAKGVIRKDAGAPTTAVGSSSGNEKN
jgi:hypothetical protein